MSIDYSAEYGIGYGVCESEEISETEELEDGLHEYIESQCGEEFECFQPGNAMTGDFESVFLVFKDPFSKGMDLTWVRNALDEEVARLKLEVEEDFGVVGGLHIY